MRKEWSKEEEDFLVKNHNKMTNKELSLCLNRSISSIEGKIHRYIANKNSSKKWEENDILFLKENYNILPISEIAKKLNRTYSSIISKANKMGLSISREWSENELKMLAELYPKYSNEYLIENFFVNRNKGQLIMMAQKLNIFKENNTSSFGKTSIFEPTGELCLSDGERKIVKFLYDNNIQYEKEVMYRDFVKDDRCGAFRFDFKIKDFFIEYFGLYDSNIGNYKEKANLKMEICKDNKVNCIFLFPKDIKNIEKILNYIILTQQ